MRAKSLIILGTPENIKKSLIYYVHNLCANKFVDFRLAEVGKLESPKSSGKYDTGQLILHKVFGYRGVILFPWLARVYDRDATNKKENTEPSSSADTSGDSLSHVGKEVKGRTHTFYQVLIDTRDAPYIVSIYVLLNTMPL